MEYLTLLMEYLICTRIWNGKVVTIAFFGNYLQFEKYRITSGICLRRLRNETLKSLIYFDHKCPINGCADTKHIKLLE